MLYSEQDKKEIQSQLTRRIVVTALLLLLPNIAALVVMLTTRVRVLTYVLSMAGAALAIFYWGLWCTPVLSYFKYLREVLSGRSHAFSGLLREVQQDSVREGVPCKTLLFADDAGDDEKLCYLDVEKAGGAALNEGARYAVSVHGQSIVAIDPE